MKCLEKSKKKLALNKRTISKLSKNEMESLAAGGIFIPDGTVLSALIGCKVTVFGPGCPLTAQE